MSQRLPRTEYLALIGLLVLAAFLRLYRLDLIDFRFDQAYPLQYAQDIVRGYFWGVQPHGSVANHPAVYLYVMAVPYLVTSNFGVIAVYRILLDVVAVGLCWLIGQRYFNVRVAFIGALLFAVGPWAIQFARNFWPVPQPLFACIALLGLIELVQRKNAWGWAIAGWGLALTAGTHLGGLFVLPVGLLAYGLSRKSFKLLPAVIGALPAVLVMGAYVSYDAASNFENLRAYATAVGGGSTFSLNPIVFVAWLSGGSHLSDLTGVSYSVWQSQTLAGGWVDGLQVALLALSVGGIGLHLAQHWLARSRGRAPADSHDAALLILWLWLSVPVLLQLRSARPVMLQYLPVLWPVPFLLMAIALDWIGRKTKQHVSRAAIAAAVGLIVGWQVYLTLHFTRFIEAHDTTGGYGLPVRGAWDARNAVLQAQRLEDAGDVIVVINGFPTPWNEQAAILRSVLADIPYRFLNSESDGFLMRPGKTHYLFAPGSEPMLNRLQQLALPEHVQLQHFSAGANRVRYTVASLEQPIGSSSTSSNFQTQPNPVWANRVELVQYRISQQPGHLTLEAVLRVLEQPQEGANFHWFNRVFVGDKQVAQLDGAGVHPSSWRTGDLVYTSFTMPLPNDKPTHVRIGSYTYPDVKAVMVSIPGQPAEDGVTLAIP